MLNCRPLGIGVVHTTLPAASRQLTETGPTRSPVGARFQYSDFTDGSGAGGDALFWIGSAEPLEHAIRTTSKLRCIRGQRAAPPRLFHGKSGHEICRSEATARDHERIDRAPEPVAGR